MNHRNRAFTLIELLVVIAIIAILASLMFTALSGSRKKSNQATSMNNLRQWGAALTQSLAEFNGEMPSTGAQGGVMQLEDENAWFNRLPRFLTEKPLKHDDYKSKPPRPGDKSVWVNPAVPKEEGSKYVNPPSQFLFSYAMNEYLSNPSEPTQPMSRVERPSATVFMSEKGDDQPICDPSKIKAYFGDGDPLADKLNQAHFLFLDGHVELKKRQEFDPELVKGTDESPGPIDNVNLNRQFTYIPYPGAKKE